MRSRFRVVAFVLVGACSPTDSFTDLNPEGPPVILQVRLTETYRDSTQRLAQRPVFAFGSHPMASDEDAHPVATAAASRQRLRIVVDELLVGNTLEEVECRAPIDDDAFDTVPLGATPDDIAACAVPGDSLAASCRGSKAVCLCQRDSGCGAAAKGEPVGVRDVNQDGAADNTGFRRGAVGIHCSGIEVPIDLDKSYWNPSGDQQVPAQGGFDALGPAIVLVPRDELLPTNLNCGLRFSTDVRDKQSKSVCAPPAGRARHCDPDLRGVACQAALECSAGDVSAFSFSVEPLRIAVTIADSMGLVASIVGDANTAIAAESLGAVTITDGTTSPAFTMTTPAPTQFEMTFAAPLAAATAYTLTIPTTVTDTFGQGLPAPIIVRFTTP